MERNIDVVEQLRLKNQELYINKLIIDLENAMDSLIIFYSNYCDTLSLDVSNTIVSYLNENTIEYQEMIIKVVTSFFSLLNDKLNKEINERFNIIKKNIKKIDSLSYETKLEEESLIISNSLSDYYQDNINMLIEEIINIIIQEKRNDLQEYLQTIIHRKLINTLKDKLAYTIKLINNNYDVNTMMLQSINEKTLK